MIANHIMKNLIKTLTSSYSTPSSNSTVENLEAVKLFEKKISTELPNFNLDRCLTYEECLEKWQKLHNLLFLEIKQLPSDLSKDKVTEKILQFIILYGNLDAYYSSFIFKLLQEYPNESSWGIADVFAF